MFNNFFSSYKTGKTVTPIVVSLNRLKKDRIDVWETTEFVFCKRKFDAVIIDASSSGLKLSCEIQLGVGSIIQLLNPSITGKIVWRDDKKNLLGIKFLKEDEQTFVDSWGYIPEEL